VGLGVGEGTPDDTTLVVFRRRLGPERMERFFKRINEQAKGKYTEETDQIIGEMEGMFYGEEKVVSLVDSDARWGYKDEDHPFCGYKVHVGCDESEIVTSVELLSGNENEGRVRVFVGEDYQLKLLDENPEQEVT